jgi:hypothetical protein
MLLRDITQGTSDKASYLYVLSRVHIILRGNLHCIKPPPVRRFASVISIRRMFLLLLLCSPSFDITQKAFHVILQLT